MHASQYDEDGRTLVRHKRYGEETSRTSHTEPYFYVDHSEGYSLPPHIEGRVERGVDVRAYDGTRLDRVVLQSTHDMRGDEDRPGARDVAENHYEADIPFERRFYIDEVEEGFRDDEPSVWHVDIEVATTGAIDAMDPRDPVVSISAYAAKHDTFFDLLLAPGPGSLGGHEVEKDDGGRAYISPEWARGMGANERSERVYVFKDEKDLLNAFADVVRRSDAEVLTGWNFEEFDAAYLINRMAEVDGCDPDRLAPFGESYTSSWTNKDGRQNIKSVIKGVDVFDMMTAYKRQKRRDSPPSWSLADVARHEGLEVGKLDVDASRLADEWRADPVRVMEYNRRDAQLTHLLDQRMETFEQFLTFHRELAVPFADTTKNSVLVEMYVMSRAPEWGIPNNEVILDSKTTNENDFEGGRTVEPRPGAYEFVFSVDVTSEYPNWIRAANLSKETAVLPGDERFGHPDNIRTPEGMPVEFLPHGERLGILPRAADEIMELKERATERRDAAEGGTTEWELADDARTTAKELANSLQGVSGMDTHRLSSNEVASSITAFGRETVGFMRRVGADLGHTFVYGDTDSAFFHNAGIRTVEDAVEAAEELAEAVNERFGGWVEREFNIPADRSHHLEVEPDKVAKRAFFPEKKKRYTLWLAWKDGKAVDKISHTGWEVVRSDASDLDDRVQRRTLEAVIHNKSEEYVTEHIKREMRRAADGEYEPHQLARALGSNMALEAYGDNPGELDFENVPYFVAAMVSSNELLGTDFRGGDKTYVVPVITDKTVELNGSRNQVNYLSIKEGDGLPDWARINTSKVLGGAVKKVESIYDTAGWDAGPLREYRNELVREAEAAHTASMHNTLDAFIT